MKHPLATIGHSLIGSHRHHPGFDRPNAPARPANVALTDRADWNYVESVGFSLSPAQLIGLLVPGFFGRGPAFHWGLWPRVEVGYIGVITLILALLGIFMKRDKLTWLMVGLAALSLAFSLGIYSIVHGWFTWLLPGLEQLRPRPFHLSLRSGGGDPGRPGLAGLNRTLDKRPDEPPLTAFGDSSRQGCDCHRCRHSGHVRHSASHANG